MSTFAGRRHERLSARVGRGAALLDAEFPGWESRIDPGRLDVRHGDRCLLGQLYGDMRQGVAHLVLFPWEVTSHGFHAGWPSRLLGSGTRDDRSLAQFWAAEVRTRRGKAGAGRVVMPPRVAANPVLV